jgi:hypothetical protein
LSNKNLENRVLALELEVKDLRRLVDQYIYSNSIEYSDTDMVSDPPKNYASIEGHASANYNYSKNEIGRCFRV